MESESGLETKIIIIKEEISLTDILKLVDIQRLQDIFADTHNVASIITNIDGTPITNPSNFTRLCNNIIRETKIGLANCYKSNAETGRAQNSGSFIMPCIGCGLWEAVANIYVGNKHIANWMIGQVRNEKPDEQQLIKYASEIGVEHNEFIAAWNEVPVMSHEQFRKIANMLLAFANELSEKANQNLQLKAEIAKRDQTADLLKKSDEQFRHAFEYSAVGTSLVSDDGHFIRINRTLEELLLYHNDEITKLTFNDITHPEDVSIGVGYLNKLLNHELKSITFEKRYIRKDGKIVFASTSSSLITNNSASKPYIITQIIDISERKHAEEMLLSSMSLLNATLESTADGILVVDINGKVTQFNKKFSDLWHLPKELLDKKQDFLLLNYVISQLAEPEKFISKVDYLYKNTNESSFEEIKLNDGRTFERYSQPQKIDNHILGRVWSFRDITESKHILEELRKSEIKYKAIVENSNDGISIANTDGKYVFVNEAFCKMTGYSESELLTMKVNDLLPKQTAIQLFTKVVFDNKSGFKEAELQKKDKTNFIALINGSPIEIGNQRFVQGIIRNITEQKLAEEKLKENNSKLDLAMKVANMAWWQMDIVTGNITFENRKAEMLGYSPEQFIHYSDFTSLVHPDDYNKTMEVMQNHIIGVLDKYEVEYRIKTQTGDYKWFYDIGTITKRDSNGKPLNVVGLVLDISERKRAEEEILTILRTAIDGFYIVGMDGQILETNDSYCSMIGYSRDELLKMKVQDIEAAENEELIKKRIQRIIQNKSDRFETKHKRKNGEIIDIEASINIIVQEKPKLICFMRDITERKLAEEQLKANEKMLYESQLIAGLGSYELDISSGMWISSLILDTIFGIDESYLHTIENWVALIHPDWQEIMANYFANEVIGKCSRFNKEYKIKRINDGVDRWVHGLGELELDVKGKPMKMHGTIMDITERKRAEIALLESEAKYSRIVNTAGEGIIMVNDKFIITYTNAQMTNMLGYQSDEIINHSLEEFIFNPDLEKHQQSMIKRKIGQTEIYERRFCKKDGSIVWFSVSANPIMDGTSEFQGSFAMFTDITDRKLFEEILKLNEERLQKLINSVTDYIYTVTIVNNIVTETLHSEGCFAITGYTSVEFENDKFLWFKIVFEDDRTAVIEQVVKLMKEKEIKPLEHRIIHKNGSQRWVCNTPVLRYNAEGELVGYDGLIADITERKKAEQIILRLQKAVESSKTCIIITTINGDIEYANPFFTELTGYLPDEYIGKNPRILKSSYHPKEFYQDLWETIKSGKTWEGEICNRKKNDDLYWEKAIISPIINENKSIINFVAVKTDITEQKQTDRKILNASIEAEERERLYFSRELHDGIGPLLSSIKLYHQWLNKPNLQTPKEEILINIDNTIQEAIASIKEISQKLSPHVLTNFGLQYAIRLFIDKLKDTCPITINFESDIDVRLDKDIEITIYRIIIECLNNTIKYANAKNVSIVLQKEQNKIIATYNDDGIGFDFEETIKSGKGLGLYNMQNRVKTLGGNLHIESQTSKGIQIKMAIDL
jgi:PAS domain S-box-containing protein